MDKEVSYTRIEFYNGDLDNMILSRDGGLAVPRAGEAVALGFDIFEVQSVSYNLDYLGTGYEVWRANVILATRKESSA